MDSELPPLSGTGSQQSDREPAERPEAIAALIRTIERRYGYLPGSYVPALEAHDVLADLWQHARRAYLDNPLPDPFKDRLLMYLGRHSSAPYALLFHGAALLVRGADPPSEALLSAPGRPPPELLSQSIELLATAPGIDLVWPEPESELEAALFRCLEAIFIGHERAPRCRDTLKTFLGPANAARLFGLLGYARSMHLWAETNPEVCFVVDEAMEEHLDRLLALLPGLPRLIESLPVEAGPPVREGPRPLLPPHVIEPPTDFVFRIRVRPKPEVEHLSDSFERLTGHSVEAFRTDPDLLMQIVEDEDREAMREILTRRPHVVSPRVIRFRRSNGETLWLELRVASEVDDTGEVIAVEGIARDVTDRVRAEKLVKSSSRLLHTVLELMPDAVLVFTPGQRIAAANRAAEQMFGYGPDELARLDPARLNVDRAHFERLLDTLRRRFQAETVVQLDLTMRRRDGELFPTEQTVTAMRGEDGEPLGFVAVIRDTSLRRQAEVAVRTAEARWRTFTDHAPQHVLTLSPDFEITFANRGFDPEHPLPVGKRLFDHLPPDAREPLRKALERASETHRPEQFDARGFDVEGRPTYLQISVAPLGRNGELMEFLITFFDVTELKRTEAALRESEALWRLLVESSPQSIVTVEPDFRISFLNRSFAGRPAEELLNTDALAWVSPGERDRARAILEEVLRTGTPATYETEIVSAEGEPVWMEVTAARLERSDGSRALLLNAHDIRDRKRAEQRLREWEQRWRSILQNAPNTILSLDLEGRITFVNHALPGSATRSMLGKSIYELLAPEYREMLRELLQRVVKTGRRETWEMSGLGPAGLTACFQNSVGPLTVDGRVESLVMVSTDITDRKQAETALQESEERFRTVFEHGPIGMAIFGPDLTVLRANRALCRMLALDEDCVSFSIEETYPPGQAQVPVDLARRLFSGELDRLDFERPIVTRDGRMIWGHVIASVVRDASGRPLYGLWMVEDIDERRKTEQALRRSAAQLAEAQRLAHVGSWSWSFEDRSFDCSDELLRIYGLEREEVGGDYRALASRVHPEDREKVRRITRATLKWHRPYDFEHRIVRPDGTVRIVRSRGSVEYDAAGRPHCVYGTVEDVTEARRAFEERTRLYREAKSAVRARDEFLSIASHDLKTPLNALKLQVQALKRAVHSHEAAQLTPEQLLHRLESAERQIEKVVKLLGVLLDVTRISAGRMQLDYEPIALGTLACELVSRVREWPEARGTPIRLSVPQPIHGRWDRLRLEQVLNNLLSNALKYGEKRPVDLEMVRDGDQVVISVRDRGKGIAPEAQARIFDRFERAAGKHPGSFGLGLWIVRQVVEAMHGAVGVVSEEGRGATFTVRLPLEPPE